MADYAIEAATARKADAAVEFKFSVFAWEILYNLLGLYALPLILWNHGRIGARNRLFLACSIYSFVQWFWASGFILLNVLHGMYHNTEGYNLTHFEVIFVDILYLLRCMTVAAKYSFYSWAELREVDVRPLEATRISEKLVLAGWTKPTPHLLYAELERSLVRLSPNMCSHKILYGDVTSRDAMLWEIRKCIPSYLEYELGIDIKNEKLEVGDSAIDLKGAGSVYVASLDGGSTAVSVRDTSIEARAFRKLCDWLNSGNTRYCEYDLQSAMKDAIRTSSKQPLSSRSASSSSLLAEGEKQPPPPPGGRPKHVEMTTEMLPYIPAKLVCWHAVFDSHVTGTPKWSFAWYISYFCGWVFAFLPSIVRGALGQPPFGSMWAAWVVEALLIYAASANFALTCRYVFVAPLDFSRRLKAMSLLSSCIDPMSPIATEFKIPVERPVSKTSDLSIDPRVAGDRNGLVNLLPASALPISRVAAERVSELEVTFADTTEGVARSVRGSRASGTNWRLDGGARITAGHGNKEWNNGHPRTSFSSAARALAAVPVTFLAPTTMALQGTARESADAEISASDLSAVANSAKSGGSIEGWLVKRAVRTGNAFFAANSWKNRYFVGDADTHSIAYSMGPGQPSLNTIKVGPFSKIERFNGRPHAFQLTIDVTGRNSQDVLVAAATTDATMEAWIAFIQGMVDSTTISSSAYSTNPLSASENMPKAAGALSLVQVSAVPVRRIAANGASPVGGGRAAVINPADSHDDQEDSAAEGLRDSDDEEADAFGADAAAKPHASTVRASILARHRLLAMIPKDGSDADSDSKLYFPVLYGENLVSWMAIRQVILDFGEAYKRRIQLYTAFFAVFCVLAIILLFFQFGQGDMSQSEKFIMMGLAAFAQFIFSIILAFSIVMGANLNDAAVLHRFRLSRIETLICDFLVAAETPGLSSTGRSLGAMGGDNPMQRQLALTRQVASSLSTALLIETSILPARVLFMPANFALLSTFWSLSMSGVLSAIRTFRL